MTVSQLAINIPQATSGYQSIGRVATHPISIAVMGIAIGALIVYRKLLIERSVFLVKRTAFVNEERTQSAIMGRYRAEQLSTAQQLAELERTSNELRTKCAKLTLEQKPQKQIEADLERLQQQQRDLDTRREALIQEQKSLSENKAALEGQVQEAQEALRLLNVELQTVRHELTQSKTEVGDLKERRNRLQYDTVLWTDEGYVICDSSCFPSTSMVHRQGFKDCAKLASEVQERLAQVEAKESRERSDLRSMPKHVYLGNVSPIQLRLFVRFVEQGAAAVREYAPEDHEALCVVADYMQVPKPKFDTPMIGELRRQVTGALLQVKELRGECEGSNEKLEKLKTKLRRYRKSLIANGLHETEAGALFLRMFH